MKAPTGNSADYKHAAAEDLGRIGLVARAEEIFYGSPMGRGSDRTAMAVVAEINDDADRFLRPVVFGRPLSRSVMQAAENFGTIPLRDGSTQATAKLLPFGGDACAVFAFIETVVLINEAQANERLNYTQRLMLNPTIQSAAMDLVTWSLPRTTRCRATRSTARKTCSSPSSAERPQSSSPTIAICVRACSRSTSRR